MSERVSQWVSKWMTELLGELLKDCDWLIELVSEWDGSEWARERPSEPASGIVGPWMIIQIIDSLHECLSGRLIDALIGRWLSGWVGVIMHASASASVGEWMCKWLTERECVIVWMLVRLSECVCASMNEWLIEWQSGWVTQWAGRWIFA